MTRIYLVRHAEAEGNLYRRVQGWYNSLITENGHRQIAALAHRFADIHIDAVYSSDLKRTMTTAMAIYVPKKLPLHTTPQLREVHMGVWEDDTWGSLALHDREALGLFNTSSPRWRVEDGESFAEVGARVTAAILEIAAAHPDQTVAIVCHGMAIRCVQATLRGLMPERLGELGHSDNTGVTCIDVEGTAATVVFENDNSHLTDEISTLASQKWWKEEGGSVLDANLWYRPMALEREAAFYCACRQEAWESIYGGLRGYDGPALLEAARRLSCQGPRTVQCIMLGEKPIGLLQLEPAQQRDEGRGHISFLYLAPDYRSRGLGIQLIGEAVSFYRPLGRTHLSLRCTPINQMAQRFYARYGFQKAGQAQGANGPLYVLEKSISLDAAR